MKVQKLAVAVAAAMMVSAQGIMTGESGEVFVRAVREKNGAKVEELLAANGSTLINAKDVHGDTALIVAVGRRDDVWTGFLLSNGADPNLANRNGDTPLITAARLGYRQGVEWLLGRQARIDDANKMGETALIVAVQARQADLVKMLLARGANPDKPDNAAGYSARDYAKRDNRNPAILRAIEAARKPAPATSK